MTILKQSTEWITEEVPDEENPEGGTKTNRFTQPRLDFVVGPVSVEIKIMHYAYTHSCDIRGKNTYHYGIDNNIHGRSTCALLFISITKIMYLTQISTLMNFNFVAQYVRLNTKF